MRLLHVSDTHLHAADASTHYPEIDTRARLSTVLAAARAHGPYDLIALTGDICDDGSRAGAEATRDLLRTAYPGVPIAAAPGNHDLTDVVAEVFGAVPARLGPWRVVVAVTNVAQQIEGEASGSLRALAHVDPEDPAPILLLQHHPLRSRSTHDWFVLRDGHRLEQRLGDFAGPIVLLTGHTHEAFESREGTVHHIGAPSSYYAIEHDGQEWTKTATGTGALVIDLTDEGTATATPIWA